MTLIITIIIMVVLIGCFFWVTESPESFYAAVAFIMVFMMIYALVGSIREAL